MATNTGTLTQLVAIGAIDNLIHGDAKFTFWRSGYSKSTRFTMESIKQDFTTLAHFGSHAELTLGRTGDLIYHMYLMMELPGISIAEDPGGGRPSASLVRRKRKQGKTWEPEVAGEAPCSACDEEDKAAFSEFQGAQDGWRQGVYNSCEDCNETIKIDRSSEECEYENCPWVHWANAIGQLIVEHARLEIGGSKIDDLWGEFMFCWEELSGKVGRRLLEMVGKRYTRQELIIDSSETRRLYVPLPFWFTQASGHALSLTSLQFHSVKVWVKFRNLGDCLVVNMPLDPETKKPTWAGYKIINCKRGGLLQDSDLQASILSTYVYLDQPERERFASSNMEYIVQQHQRMVANGSNSDTIKLQLNFNHPVIELIWFVRRRCNQNQGAWFNFSGLEMRDPIKSISLKLNAQDRLDNSMPAEYFRLVQPYQHHSCIPDTFVYCYSFALHPEDSTTPSGACNMSRIDNTEFEVTLQEGLQSEPVELMVFAVSWNIVRFREGLAGLAYTN
jgi:hypothetical protein